MDQVAYNFWPELGPLKKCNETFLNLKPPFLSYLQRATEFYLLTPLPQNACKPRPNGPTLMVGTFSMLFWKVTPTNVQTFGTTHCFIPSQYARLAVQLDYNLSRIWHGKARPTN